MRRVAGYLFGYMKQHAPKGVTPALAVLDIASHSRSPQRGLR